MNEFLKKVAQILEVGQVAEGDDLKAFPQWDSLAVLSVIAMLDADYSVNLKASEIGEAKSAGDLWRLVETRRPT
jgi:acyl carrier protein